LQIDTDLLLTATITDGELFSGSNIDDFKQPWNSNICHRDILQNLI